MIGRRTLLAAGAAALARPALPTQPAAVALVLAMDVSGSVSPESFRLQRDATADALLTPAVRAAAESGLALAVTMWGTDQHVALPWRTLRDAADLSAAAQAIRAVPRPEIGTTDLARALDHAAALFAALDAEPERKVVDLSGDGRHSGHPVDVEASVAYAVAAGIEVNALPIVTETEPDVAEWYRRHVTAPAGGFSIPADWSSFARAIRMKLAMEVS